jgi:hypothetical protein
MNLSWAGGQIVGSGAGGGLAKAAGDAVPVTITAGLCAATLLLITRLAGSGASKSRQPSEAKLRA